MMSSGDKPDRERSPGWSGRDADGRALHAEQDAPEVDTPEAKAPPPARGARDPSRDGAKARKPPTSSPDTPPAPRPRNPWQPAGDTPPPRRSAGIEDIFRQRGKGTGGNGTAGPQSGGSGPALRGQGSGRGSGSGGRRPGLIPQHAIDEARGWLPWALATAAILLVASTTVHMLGSNEAGLVTTFGKYSHTVGSGLSLTAPWPIQRIAVTDMTSIRRIAVPDGDQEQLLLTSDRNLVSVSYLVRWSVRDLRQFDTSVRDPAEAVREVAAAAMRAAVAQTPLSDLIGGGGRPRVEADAARRMQAVLNAWRAGVAVQGVDVIRADPPEKLAAAFQKVTDARQDVGRDQATARTYAQQVIARAQGDAAAFDTLYQQYRLAPEVTRRRLYYETMEKVLGANDKIVVGGNTATTLPLPDLARRPPPDAAPAAPVAGP
jgi:membrane protease subunit HflK